ncbi:MAG: DUF192 domain-containing protein [Pseudomonadota bacterium]
MTRIVALASLFLIFGPWLAFAQGQSDCSPDSVHFRTEGNNARFGVEIVDTPEERSRGLMFRENLPQSMGMLFIYEHPQTVAFWMRNTLIPLDMIFMDDRGVVQRVHENAEPLDETAIPGGQGIQYVLEVNGGLARALGIGPGAEMRHPALGVEAAWPCGD